MNTRIAACAFVLSTSLLAINAAAQTGPSVREVFNRIDTNPGEIDTQEFGAYLRSLGIGQGMMGPTEIALAQEQFLESFDADGNQTVSFLEFVQGSYLLLPVELVDENGQLDKARIPGLMPMISENGAYVTETSIHPYLEREIRARTTGLKRLFAGRMASAAAKVTIDMLDADGDLAFTAEDLEIYIDDIEAELDAHGV
jgi:hypothetical protein